MSLRGFHLLFIGVSILLALGFAAWSLKGAIEGGGIGQVVAAVVSLLVAVGLIVYGKRVRLKFKRLG